MSNSEVLVPALITLVAAVAAIVALFAVTWKMSAEEFQLVLWPATIVLIGVSVAIGGSFMLITLQKVP